MKKYIIIGVVVLLLLVGLGYWMMTDDDVEVLTTDAGTQCMVPTSYPTWDVNSINWGAFDTGVRDYIGDKAVNAPPTLSFFKSINVQPSRALIRKYQKEIKAYIAANGNAPHWDIVKGEGLCS